MLPRKKAFANISSESQEEITPLLGWPAIQRPGILSLGEEVRDSEGGSPVRMGLGSLQGQGRHSRQAGSPQEPGEESRPLEPAEGTWSLLML